MRNMIFNLLYREPQWHHQEVANPLSDYLKYGSNGEPNIKYNSGWGYKNGEKYSFAKKLLPQTSFFNQLGF
jgi:hypothetical protein